MEEVSPGNYMFKNATTFVKWWLRLKNELFTWGINPNEIGNFLKKNGWDLIAVFDYKKLKSEYLSPGNQHLPAAIGEDVVICVK